MKLTINVTDECAKLIRANADSSTFKQTGRQLPDGTWDIPIDQDVKDAITARQLAGETISDSIMRVIATANGHRH